MEEIAIKVDSVSKVFKLPHEKQSSIKGLFVNLFRGKRTYEKQIVLDNVSFDINKGEFFGIVGRNGSGKSTLLKMLAGVYTPNAGSIHINGKLTPFIELGVGFNPELTGRENVFLNGALLGFDRKEMSTMYNEIVEFAELEKFMDQKLKNYSSGMQVRLAFSIAIRAKNEILLLDEVLAVGDSLFQKKCFDYFKQLKKDKRTVVFVSHDSNALLEYCDKGILIEKGKIIYEGNIDKLVNTYTDILNNEENVGVTVQKENSRWGTGDAKVIKTDFRNDKGVVKKVFSESDENICFRVQYQAVKIISNPTYGITISDLSGQRIFTSNTMWSHINTDDLDPAQKVVVVWTVPNIFNSGTYKISPAIADASGATTFDWLDEAGEFKVRKKVTSNAYANPTHKIEIEGKKI